MSDDTKPPEDPSPKANEHTTPPDPGLVSPPNKLDDLAAVEPFNQSAGLPAESVPSTPEPGLALNPPTPAGLVSPPLRDPDDQTQDHREAFKKAMLLRQQFRENARDMTDRDR